MRRHGSVILSCLGCMGFMLLLLVVSWLGRGCGGVFATVPPADSTVEFSFDCSTDNRNCRLEVSRKLAKVQIVDKDRRSIYALTEAATPSARTGWPPGPGWLLRDADRTFVIVSSDRLQRLGQSGLPQRLIDVWDQLGESKNRRLLEDLLPARQHLGAGFQGSSLSILDGPLWLQQKTLQLTYARRVMGSGVIAVPVGWKYFQRAYAPRLGLVLNSQQSDRGADSVADEALFANIPLSNLKIEHFDPGHFEVPQGYRERWDDRELRESTPHTAFSSKPPRDYRQIGTTSISQQSWNERSVMLIREDYLQKNSHPKHWKFEIFVYFLENPQEVDPFLQSLDLRWRGMKGWDNQARAAEATARLDSGLLIKKKCILVRLDLKYFLQGKPGEYKAGDDPESQQELQTLARELSQGLP